jgi:predicted small metal-binding protein
MFLSFEEINILMAARSESQISTEEEYREYLCKEVYKNKECGFKVQAKTEEETFEHALRHREQAHGMTETSPEIERAIRRDIRPASLEEEYREYTCSEPGCDFSIQAKNEDELIGHAHMHQELEHGVKERSPEIERDIRRDIRPVSTEEGYTGYTCSEPGCDFSVSARSEDELIEHAHMHQELEHGVKERSPEIESDIRRDIRQVPSAEEYKEYACSDPECDFSMRAKAEDEIIKHAHMHQELEHGVTERSPETEKKIIAHITPVTIL